jgi:hypothetical protein
MAALNEISGIGETSLRLLQSAGIGSVEELMAQDVDTLVAGLRRASDTIGLVGKPPAKATVEKWITKAAALAETEKGQAPRANRRVSPETAAMLERSPFAIPLPGNVIIGNGLGVSDVPAGIPLDYNSGNLDARADDAVSPKTEVPARRTSGNIATVSTQVERRQYDASMAKTPKPAHGGKRVPKTNAKDEKGRVALIRAPREGTNRGKNPESRKFVRGVLYPHPWGLRMGALFTLLLLIHLPLAIMSAFLLLASREAPGTFAWVPEWVLAITITLPLTGLGYLLWGFTGKCRICTQKLFIHRSARKHIKAHRFPGMGFIIPLSFHLLTFGWFRCSSCGTPVRLKK